MIMHGTHKCIFKGHGGVECCLFFFTLLVLVGTFVLILSQLELFWMTRVVNVQALSMPFPMLIPRLLWMARVVDVHVSLLTTREESQFHKTHQMSWLITQSWRWRVWSKMIAFFFCPFLCITFIKIELARRWETRRRRSGHSLWGECPPVPLVGKEIQFRV